MGEEITVADRMEQIGETVRNRVKPYFLRQRIDYPPAKLALVTVKDEQRLKVYAPDETGDWRFVMQYQIAKLSGKAGPKLRNGDEQVPEGIYRVTYLNPMSKYWLSLALNYPNEFDRRMARADKRKSLGGDIMIHGWWFSTGCVAVGNTAAEDMFVLAKDVGMSDVKVIITPTDFRKSEVDESVLPGKPSWIKHLYADLEDELNELGSDGITTETKLIAYADLAPPPPPKPTTLLGKMLRALAEAAETSETKTGKSK
jgi:hypothetical protein